MVLFYVGPGVKTVSIGDLVVLHWRKGTGIQSDTPRYLWRDKEINADDDFNKHAIISENRYLNTHDTNIELAALFGCA